MTDQHDPLMDTLAQRTSHSQKSSFTGVKERASFSEDDFRSGLDSLDLAEVVESGPPPVPAEMAMDAVELEPLEPTETAETGGVESAEAIPPTEEITAVVPAVQPAEGLLARVWRTFVDWLRS